MIAEPQSFNLFGLDLFDRPVLQRKSGVLAERFEFPPFSVLDARGGEWQERKAAWLRLGLAGEIGRPEGLHANRAGFTSLEKYDGSRRASNGTSVFDPALCELAYRWFCPAGGLVLDPFAGGSVRGVVASLLGFRYWGSELRAEQCAANEEQRELICPGDGGPEWVCGDSRETLTGAPAADFLFTCPPYGDLERYSDNPADLSTMAYEQFLVAYWEILAKAAARLRPNRFACLVVGEFRDPKTGVYRGFVADTVKAAGAAGLALYNDAVLLTSIGSLPIRSGKIFTAGRKLGKAHQNVLVFVKGDWKVAAQACEGSEA